MLTLHGVDLLTHLHISTCRAETVLELMQDPANILPAYEVCLSLRLLEHQAMLVCSATGCEPQMPSQCCPSLAPALVVHCRP
jgi:hypothetical protein